MTGLTDRELEAISRLIAGEELACKKARIYARTLTDAALAQQMDKAAEAHAQRFCDLCALLGGEA